MLQSVTNLRLEEIILKPSTAKLITIRRMEIDMTNLTTHQKTLYEAIGDALDHLVARSKHCLNLLLEDSEEDAQNLVKTVLEHNNLTKEIFFENLQQLLNGTFDFDISVENDPEFDDSSNGEVEAITSQSSFNKARDSNPELKGELVACVEQAGYLLSAKKIIDEKRDYATAARICIRGFETVKPVASNLQHSATTTRNGFMAFLERLLKACREFLFGVKPAESQPDHQPVRAVLKEEQRPRSNSRASLFHRTPEQMLQRSAMAVQKQNPNRLTLPCGTI